MDLVIPSSKISSLSSGDFVGIVADNPEQKIELKMFHSAFQNDHAAIAKEESSYRQIPTIANVSNKDLQENYLKIKQEVLVLVAVVLKLIASKPKRSIEGKKKQANKQEIRKSIVPERKIKNAGNQTGNTVSM